ncbi:DUF551 domain-containing protein [Oscillibacter sp. MSJ-2]|uniref:DUF551 domain-containing protein n=1 Tax=Dysosmobacter acutus TaxID=2841504 RepID=A0ABS6FBS4_9FIRM|nr:DUF551 domain-containing protein [Dysosmobacter acutus]MBU5627720.1 DUF551 domain-containing protein [Dysosmobacter acutus]
MISNALNVTGEQTIIFRETIVPTAALVWTCRRERRSATISKWISVKERLPGCGERVLATDGTFVGEAYRTSAKSWYRMSGFAWRDALGTIVTHWMPLPEPPKEDDHG